MKYTEGKPCARPTYFALRSIVSNRRLRAVEAAVKPWNGVRRIVRECRITLSSRVLERLQNSALVNRSALPYNDPLHTLNGHR